jgi:hypothetical protein
MAKQLPDTDKSVIVPAAVAAAAARAAELQNQFIQGDNPPADPPPEPQDDQEGDPPAEQHFQRQEEPAQEDDSAAPGTWQHKYLSMKGRYDSEVPRMRSQMAELSDRIANLNNVIASMEAAPRRTEAPAPQVKSLLTAEEEAEYGPDFIDVATRIAQQATAPFQEEINRLKEQVGGVGKQLKLSARDTLIQNMDKSLPDWRAINNAPDFVSWLKLTDAYSGNIRHNMLKAAYERNDFPRVSAFFQGFLAEMAATETANDEPTPNAQFAPRVPLRNLAAPGRAKSAAAPGAPAEKPTITRSSITKFYADRAAGKFRGREAEAAQFENSIFAAEKEGRIQ